MSASPTGDQIRPTQTARRVDLEEILQQVRRELAARDEDPTGAWVEGSALELLRGEKPGWYWTGGGRTGLAFYARRASSAYGHLHTDGGVSAAVRLAGSLLEALPAEVRSLDLGFSGLAPADELELVRRLAERPGSTVIARQAMERTLDRSDERWPSEPPSGLERIPVGAVTPEALADLDRRSFAGSIDALLVGDEPEANQRSIEAVLAGRLGRFLDEASTALVEPEPTRLVGAVLSAERSPRRAIVVALMVEPALRRRGLGRYLLGWTLRALRALGYESARLWVTLANTPAIELYRSFSFRPMLPATIYRWDRAESSAHPHSAP